MYLDHSARMNDLDDFGFGNICPDTLETENQQEQEQEPEQELQYTIHQLATTSDGNICPDTLETENQQEQEPE